MKINQITIHKGGTEEKTVKLKDLQIPNLWHYRDDAKPARNEILLCWHLAHDLLSALIDAHAEIKRLHHRPEIAKELERLVKIICGGEREVSVEDCDRAKAALAKSKGAEWDA